MSGPPTVIIGSMASVMPSREQRPAPRLAEIEDLRILVHRAADAVPGELADHREPGPFGHLLHGVRHVGEAIALLALLDGSIERGLACLQQPLRLVGDLAHGEREGRVGDESLRA